MNFKAKHLCARRLVIILSTLFCNTALLLPYAASSESTEKPYKVQWPEGWEVSELPGPRPNSGKNLGGKRIRALKKDQGVAAVAIELTWLPRPDNSDGGLETEFGSFSTTVKTDYEAKGYKVIATEAKHSTLGGLSDLETQITTTGKGFVLRQWTAIAIGHGYVYSLSYSGLQASFEKYKPELDACRSGLLLK